MHHISFLGDHHTSRPTSSAAHVTCNGTPSGTITVHGSAQKRPHSGPITFHGKYPLQGAAETRTWVARIRCLPLDQKLKLIVVVHHISDKCSRILFQKVVMADVRSTFVLPCRMGQNTEIWVVSSSSTLNHHIKWKLKLERHKLHQHSQILFT